MDDLNTTKIQASTILYIDEDDYYRHYIEFLFSGCHPQALMTVSWQEYCRPMVSVGQLVLASISSILYLSKWHRHELVWLSQYSQTIAVVNAKDSVYIPLLKDFMFQDVITKPLKTERLYALFKEDAFSKKESTRF